MSQKEQVMMFNNILGDLLKQLDDVNKSNYHFFYRQMIKINSYLPIDNFSKICLKYKDDIFAKNPEWFMTEEYYEEMQKDTYTKYFVQMMDLKEIYGVLDDKSKKNLWGILQALTLLAEKYLNK